MGGVGGGMCGGLCMGGEFLVGVPSSCGGVKCQGGGGFLVRIGALLVGGTSPRGSGVLLVGGGYTSIGRVVSTGGSGPVGLGSAPPGGILNWEGVVVLMLVGRCCVDGCGFLVSFVSVFAIYSWYVMVLVAWRGIVFCPWWGASC